MSIQSISIFKLKVLGYYEYKSRGGGHEKSKSAEFFKATTDLQYQPTHPFYDLNTGLFTV